MIKPSDLHQALLNAGIPIDGVSSAGRIDFKPEATQQQRDEAATILASYDQATVDQQRTNLRNQVLSVAGSAEGVLITDLTNVQVRALVACLLWKNGALTNDGHIKPLSEWVK